MTDQRDPAAADIERRCAVIAVALSAGRRGGARLVTGEQRQFGLSRTRTEVQVPYPPQGRETTSRLMTCGVALQCSPSKDRIAELPIAELSPRQRQALSIVEGGVAIGWLASTWPGLLAETVSAAAVPVLNGELDAVEILHRSAALAASGQRLHCPPLLGRLPFGANKQSGLLAMGRRAYGRMPWGSSRRAAERLMSIPVGGDGGVRNPNLPPASRPQDEEPPIRTDERLGLPYPEWNCWTGRFLVDPVAVLERRHMPNSEQQSAQLRPELRRWFRQETHRAWRGGLDDGSDLDIDRYVAHFVGRRTGHVDEPRLFRDLVPTDRDVATALLLDGSSSLKVHAGRAFELELRCADALSQAMTSARERHGVFVFSGNTRHRVDVKCLKDFDDRVMAIPSTSGLTAGGYTRLGAPIRHLTKRLLDQPAQRRSLIVMGDGLMSDEGYEGRYAWADVAHALMEAEDVGVSVFYIGVGVVTVDPLPDVFGRRRSHRIHHVEQLPASLAQVHRELIAA